MGDSETININEFLVAIHQGVVNNQPLVFIFLLALFKPLARNQ